MKHIGTHHQQNTWRIDGTEIPQRNELQRNSFPELFKSSFSIRDNSLYRLPWESLVKCASSLFFLHPFYGFARGGLDRFLTIGNLMKKTLDVFKCSIYVSCNILPIRAMHAEMFDGRLNSVFRRCIRLWKSNVTERQHDPWLRGHQVVAPERRCRLPE